MWNFFRQPLRSSLPSSAESRSSRECSSNDGSSMSSSYNISSSSTTTSYPAAFFQNTQSGCSTTTPSTIAGNPGFASRRLQKERHELRQNPLDNIRVVHDGGSAGPSSAQNHVEWLIEIKGASDTLYQSETYRLRFRFPDSYPLDSPEVLFVGAPPVHPHIYSNGHICLSILYDGWSPALGVTAICLSLISMLSSCKRKERPSDDSDYTLLCGNRVSPKQMKWVFHDDKV